MMKSKRNVGKTIITPKHNTNLKPNDRIKNCQQRIIGRKTRTKKKYTNLEEQLNSRKLMPSLAELELMYEDSQTEGNIIREQDNFCCNILTPESAINIGERLIKALPNLCKDIIVDNVNEFPSPVVPKKNHNKTNEPYIVGCKDRPKVPEKKTNPFKGGKTYGIKSSTNNFNNDEDASTKSKGCHSHWFHPSAFNGKSNEIASKLLDNKNNELEIKSHTNDQIDEDLNSTTRFSPLPSTSNDKDTILKNELKFSESIAENSKANLSYSAFKGVSPKHELIIIDDEEIVHQDIIINNPKNGNQDMSIYKVSENINNNINPVIINNLKINNNLNIETINIEETLPPSLLNTRNSPIIVEEHCSALIPRIVDEIDLTDIDCIISENESVINKYIKQNQIRTVNVVKPLEILNQHVTANLGVSNKTDRLQKCITQSSSNKVNTSACDIIEIPDTYNINTTNQNLVLNSTNRQVMSMLECNREPQLPKNRNTKPKTNQVLSQRVNETNEPLLGTCPICLNNISKNNVASTNCGHIFCPPCIKRALKSTPKKCPTCRNKLTGTGYHLIFL